MTIGSVGAEVSTRTAPRTLKSVGKFTTKPKEMQPETSGDIMDLLVSGTFDVYVDMYVRIWYVASPEEIHVRVKVRQQGVGIVDHPVT